MLVHLLRSRPAEGRDDGRAIRSDKHRTREDGTVVVRGLTIINYAVVSLVSRRQPRQLPSHETDPPARRTYFVVVDDYYC